MMNRDNLLRCKLALYRELLNAKNGAEWTRNEREIVYLLVLDEQVQNHIEKALGNDKEIESKV